MKYQDSIKQAQQKMALTAKQLAKWHLPANPINYAVCYEFITGQNKSLLIAIKQQLLIADTLDSFFIDDIYREHILGQSKFRDEIISDIDQVIHDVQQQNKQATQSSKTLIKQIDVNIEGIESNDQHEAQLAALQLRKAAIEYRVNQTKLIQQLAQAQKKAQVLREEVSEARKELYLDPLTGLYNRKAMLKHFDDWLAQDENKQISSISVSVNEIKQFSQQYGQLISDIILAKIAQKVSGYVDSSGIAVRTATDQILILLPDVETNIAGEIAEKIRLGIEKLTFVRKKTGQSMPKISLALGITSFSAKNGVNIFLKQSEKILAKAKSSASNRILYTTEH